MVLWEQDRKEYHPYCKASKWQHYGLGVFFYYGTGELVVIEDTMNAARLLTDIGWEVGIETKLAISAGQWSQTYDKATHV